MKNDLFKNLKAAGERATAFSTPAEGQRQSQRLLICLEQSGIWIRCAFAEADGMGQTEFIVSWHELADANFDVIGLGIDKCISGMGEALAARQASEALEDAAAAERVERAVQAVREATDDDAGE